MITPGGIDDNEIIRKNSPRDQAAYREIGHQKKTNILYIQYIQYSAVCGPLDAPATAHIVEPVNPQKRGRKPRGIPWGTVIGIQGTNL
jgi:hypothetical protein